MSRCPGDRTRVQREATASAERAISSLMARDVTPRLRIVAHATGTSVRTLQRRLASAGITFTMLLERSRRAAAVDGLRQTGGKVVDIALDLGYSDHAHFTRAFRRWTGLAPREFRRSTGAVRPSYPADPGRVRGDDRG